VYARDAAGKPLTSAQVQRRFAPGWNPMGKDGYVRLTRVALRLDEGPGEDAIGAAVEVKSRFHASRSAKPPTVTQREDGSWEAVFVMQIHGLLRLTLGPTELSGARAALEPDPILERFEPVDGMGVARNGQPALYRIYPALDRCRVHVMGDEGTASIRGSFERPSPGFIIERTVHALPSRPIIGKVLAPEGVKPPTLAGRIEVEQVSPDGSHIRMEPVVLHASGNFELPYAGPGEYRLQAFPGFTGPTEIKTVRGGTDFDFEHAEARPWLVIDHPDFDTKEREGRFVVLRHVGDEVERVSIQHGVIVEAKRTLIALNGFGHHDVHLTLPGTDTLAPLKTSAGIVVDKNGGHALAMRLQKAPEGSLRVFASADNVEAMRGATVILAGGRLLSWLKNAKDGVTFEHIPAGRVSVTVYWQDARYAYETAMAEVRDGETADVQVQRLRGGTLRVHPSKTGEKPPEGPLRAEFAGDQSPYEAKGAVMCSWNPGEAMWITDARLRPGTYSATLLAGNDKYGDVTFEIEADGTTDVTLK